MKDLVSLIQEKSPTLTEFSLNQGSKEIYNFEEPREILLNKTMSELSESYEFDLVLTNEETLNNVCILWIIHDENSNDITLIHEEKLIPKEVEKI